MGTRAVVRLNGEFLYATHWDGHPESLGNDLYKSKKDVDSLIRAGADNSIDFINKKYVPKKPVVVAGYEGRKMTTYFYKTDKEGSELANKLFYKGKKDPKELMKMGYGTADAEGKIKLTQVGKESEYGDWAEFIYDIRDDTVYVMEGKGEYSDTVIAERTGNVTWKKLSFRNSTPILRKAKKPKGWFSESARHSLARKGIKTGRKKR